MFCVKNLHVKKIYNAGGGVAGFKLVITKSFVFPRLKV